ncbi:MAG TPA: 2-oxoglutarate and iron-dependent oxygenase domain-containing protein [Stellaceae bacterium]|jgi:isopenicillin N synthase-like dioxygenase|nr:2-oxoglutarate and iron-dependent oxygenase domain-containing protein [Stellaceae bacterium]
MTLLSIPIIDIGPYRTGDAAAKRLVAAAVDRACRDIGFLVISGHGIDPDLVEETRAAARNFFDLPLAEKMQVGQPARDVTRGYIPVGGEAVARSRGATAAAGDLNESFMIGPIDPVDPAYATAPAAGRHFAANLWPERPVALRPAMTRYYQAMNELAQTLMHLFALGLGLDEHFFDDKIDRHISRLRLRNYPAPTASPLPGQLRAGAHSDYGSLTILATEDKPGGLQACNSAGDWVDVPSLPGCFVVNLGDLMARWTNDAWVSTLHRVVNPPDAVAAQSRRASLVFFHNPNYDAPVACIPTCLAAGDAPRYAPTTSGEHLRRLFLATQVAPPTEQRTAGD